MYLIVFDSGAIGFVLLMILDVNKKIEAACGIAGVPKGPLGRNGSSLQQAVGRKLSDSFCLTPRLSEHSSVTWTARAGALCAKCGFVS